LKNEYISIIKLLNEAFGFESSLLFFKQHRKRLLKFQINRAIDEEEAGNELRFETEHEDPNL